LKLAELRTRDRSSGPARQIAQFERTIGCADQAIDLEAEIFEHAAHLAVLALSDSHFDPLIAA